MQSWSDPARRSETVNISSTDHTFAIKSIGELHNATAAGGTVTVRLVGDAADSVWYIPSGWTIYGMFSIVRKTGTSLVAANALLGLSCHQTDS